jgi:glucose-1-phosphate adenylyltransferase
VILPNVEIGHQVTLKHAIVDKFCRIPDGFSAGIDLESDCQRFEVTDKGTVLITPEMLGQHIHSLR